MSLFYLLSLPLWALFWRENLKVSIWQVYDMLLFNRVSLFFEQSRCNWHVTFKKLSLWHTVMLTTTTWLAPWWWGHRERATYWKSGGQNGSWALLMFKKCSWQVPCVIIVISSIPPTFLKRQISQILNIYKCVQQATTTPNGF